MTKAHRRIKQEILATIENNYSDYLIIGNQLFTVKIRSNRIIEQTLIDSTAFIPIYESIVRLNSKETLIKGKGKKSWSHFGTVSKAQKDDGSLSDDISQWIRLRKALDNDDKQESDRMKSIINKDIESDKLIKEINEKNKE